jgi:hypothetical protein
MNYLHLLRNFLFIFFLTVHFSFSGQTLTSVTTISPLTISANTGEKPQSKVWNYDHKWWTVLSDSSGTYIWELKLHHNKYKWKKSLKIVESSHAYADCKLNLNLLHIFIFDKSKSLPKGSLVTVEYNNNSRTYNFWNNNSKPLNLNFDNNSIETATVDLDSKNRLWIAYEKDTKINVRWSNFPYTVWSNEFSIYSGVSKDDICSIIHLNDKIGVLWSNQKTKRFGFKFHLDSNNDGSTWSEDEIPSNDNALDIGDGMSDDHINLAVASNGTLYCAVKTSYDTPKYTKIGLIARDPNGNWSELYHVSENGTRPIVILNELSNKLQVLYTNTESGGTILFNESSSDVNQILFGHAQTLIDIQNSNRYNNASSSKSNYTSEIVILASDGNQLASVLARFKMD